MKLTDNSRAVLNYVKENGGRVATAEIAEALGKTTKQIVPNITDLCKKGLCVRETVKAEEKDGKDTVYAVITEAGKADVQTED